jgi:hypothetical protein
MDWTGHSFYTLELMGTLYAPFLGVRDTKQIYLRADAQERPKPAANQGCTVEGSFPSFLPHALLGNL